MLVALPQKLLWVYASLIVCQSMLIGWLLCENLLVELVELAEISESLLLGWKSFLAGNVVRTILLKTVLHLDVHGTWLVLSANGWGFQHTLGLLARATWWQSGDFAVRTGLLLQAETPSHYNLFRELLLVLEHLEVGVLRRDARRQIGRVDITVLVQVQSRCCRLLWLIDWVCIKGQVSHIGTKRDQTIRIVWLLLLELLRLFKHSVVSEVDLADRR